MRKVLILGGLLVASTAAFYVFAGSHQQAGHHGHHGHHGSSPTQESVSASVAAYQAINDQMHSAMSIEFTGDADIDFVRGMIPHHEGAVEMAKVVLEHGSDPEIRALAEAVVEAQEEEIEMMRRWLAERGLD
ncbi:DUF305 domain-containing protein [Nitrincola schmidtii]|uniref:CopM family metallochaperone n=1 Tax=Nitrincola schmidtii TaxID=1730894 RepID=UPI00124F1689|nr:DUF305 domain-containing protein [Nitrincola schmidtii]